MQVKINDSLLELVQGDITKEDTEAIANAKVLSKGLPASPGAATGKSVTSKISDKAGRAPYFLIFDSNGKSTGFYLPFSFSYLLPW